MIGLGDLDRAEGLVERVEGWGHATGRAWTLATAARCRALLLAARGDTDGAVQALEKALGHHQHLAMPFELGRTLLVMGQVQRRAKRKRAARQHLQRALEIFESLPAPLWAERARSELSRIGLRPPAPLALTATEERVADLAASGHTNREVAQALFLSPRTVEANLARVYRKLGCPRGPNSARSWVTAGRPRRHPEVRGSAAIEGVAGRPSCGNTRFVWGHHRLTVSVTGLQSPAEEPPHRAVKEEQCKQPPRTRSVRPALRVWRQPGALPSPRLTILRSSTCKKRSPGPAPKGSGGCGTGCA